MTTVYVTHYVYSKGDKIMEIVIHLILISTICIPGLILLKRKKTEMEYTKIYLNSI